MSWSRRTLLAAGLGAPVLLTGCFRPMLAEDSAGSAARGRIALPPVSGRLGYHLTKRLEDRLGAPNQPDHRLVVALDTAETGLAIAQDNTITRRTITATARWRLVKAPEPRPVLAGTETAQSGFNATTSLYATRVARETIERRLAEELAERIARVILARAEELAPA